MGGKKKKGGKGKKKAKENFTSNLPEPELHAALQVEFRSLQQRLLMETEMANRERAAENELRSKVEVLTYDLEEEKKRDWDVTCDMTRQYKSMQQEKDDKISVLTQSIQEYQAHIQKRNQQIEEVQKEKDSRIREKDEEISELKKKIEEMSNRFANMLKETLEQMKEKIDMVNKTWEDEIDVPNVKKIEEIAALAGS